MLPQNCQKCQQPFDRRKLDCVVSKPCDHHVCDTCWLLFPRKFGQSSFCALCGKSPEFELRIFYNRSSGYYHCGIVSLQSEEPDEVFRFCELSEVENLISKTTGNIQNIIQGKQISSQSENPEEVTRFHTITTGSSPNIIQEKQISSQSGNPEENIHKCAECETRDSEQNMHLCKTCHELEFKNVEDVKKNVLCSTCTIKKHMRQGHQTVDVFPYLSAYNFSTQSENSKSKLDEFENVRDSLKKTIQHISKLTRIVSKDYDVLTDMARRSKSTKQQVEFFEKIEKFIDESKDITSKTQTEMKSRAEQLYKQLEGLEHWCESREKDCLDESEVIKLDH